MQLESWLAGFLEQRELKQPTGEPLYSYRTSDEEYESLLGIFAQDWWRSTMADRRVVDATFCLLAAEWWHRNHEHGPWKWQGILAQAGWEDFSLPRLYSVVERGLGFWRRELLHLAGGDRAFLVTLACEGGLPLKLLLRDGAALRNYFRGLLEEVHYLRHTGASAVEIAERLANRLPSSLRQVPVFKLSGDLVARILELQATVQGAPDAVAALDRKDPLWRERMPLRVDDDMARALLNNLVEAATQLRVQRRSGLRIRRQLVRDGGLWYLTAGFSASPSLSASQLEQTFGPPAAALVGRFELYLVSPGGDRRLVALASPIAVAGTERSFRVETAAGEAGQITGAAARRSWQLAATSGGTEVGPREIAGGPLSEELPWVFVDRSGDGFALDLVGQGTVSVRYGEAWLVCPTDAELREGDGGKLTEVGELGGTAKKVLRLQGRCTVETQDGESYRVTCGEAAERSAEFVLNGLTVPSLGAMSSFFLGPPRLLSLEESGDDAEVVPANRLEWRTRVGRDLPWRAMSTDCLGEVMLRYFSDGATQWVGQAAVLPPSFRLELAPGTTRHRGEVRMKGIQGAMVECLPTEGVEAQIEAPDLADEARVILRSEHEPPATLELRLSWQGGRRVQLRATFPSRGARFLGPDGRTMGVEETVPLARLAALRAAAVTSDSHQRFYLEGALQAPGLNPARGVALGFCTQLAAVDEQQHEHELGLGSVQRVAESLLTLADGPLSRVRLSLSCEGFGQVQPRPILVERFDLFLKEDPETGDLVLGHEDPSRLAEVDLERISLQARLLTDPLLQPEALASPSAGRWFFGRATREPGPWLIAGWDGGWCRVRPLTVVVVPGAPSTEASPLARAVDLAHSQEEREELKTRVAELATDPAHPDWEFVHQHFRAHQDLPAPLLHLSRAFAKCPEALALLALKTLSSDFQAIWDAVGQLPFSWLTFPLRAWSRAAVRLTGSLRTALESLGPAAEKLIERDLSRFFQAAKPLLGHFSILHEWCLERGLGVDHPSPQLQFARDANLRLVLLSNLQRARQELRSQRSESHWPTSPGLTGSLRGLLSGPAEFACLAFRDPDGPNFAEPVFNAPVYAALSSAQDRQVTREVIYDIERLRSWAPEYFDEAYSIALALAIAHLERTNPGVLL